MVAHEYLTAEYKQQITKPASNEVLYAVIKALRDKFLLRVELKYYRGKYCFWGNYDMTSISEENKKYLQLAYRLSIILTAIGAIILLAGVLGFGNENKELDAFVVIGGIVVLVGLVCIPLITWQWMTKKEFNLKI